VSAGWETVFNRNDGPKESFEEAERRSVELEHVLQVGACTVDFHQSVAWVEQQLWDLIKDGYPGFYIASVYEDWPHMRQRNDMYGWTWTVYVGYRSWAGEFVRQVRLTP
jgi:hypothetical protein